MVENREINRTDEIGLVTPTPGAGARSIWDNWNNTMTAVLFPWLPETASHGMDFAQSNFSAVHEEEFQISVTSTYRAKYE